MKEKVKDFMSRQPLPKKTKKQKKSKVNDFSQKEEKTFYEKDACLNTDPTLEKRTCEIYGEVVED